jgi:hypothetical protein
VKNAAPPFQRLDSDDLWFYPVVSLKVRSDYNFLYITVLPESVRLNNFIAVVDFKGKS